jgi:hypothetical protein
MTRATVIDERPAQSSWVLAPASQIDRLETWQMLVERLEPDAALVVVPGNNPHLQIAALRIQGQRMRSGKPVATLTIRTSPDRS